MSEGPEERRRLLGLAYRMTGSYADAEDLVQEAYARLSAATEVRDRGAWLTTVTARLAVDHLRSARVQREAYIGPWLPEPVAELDDGPEDEVVLAESVTAAMLVVLETMSPVERAVFVLHDVFGHPHDDVAAMLDRTPAAVRQTASRARRHVDARRPRFEADPARRREVGRRFLDAVDGGDLAALVELMSPDVVFRSDGGGVVTAARKELHGPQRVVAFLAALAAGEPDGRAELTWVNASPALRLIDGQGALAAVMVLQVGPDGRVVELNTVRNPAKLGLLG